MNNNESENKKSPHQLLAEIEEREAKTSTQKSTSFQDYVVIKILLPIWIAGLAFAFIPAETPKWVKTVFYVTCGVLTIIFAIQAYRKVKDEKEEKEMDRMLKKDINKPPKPN